MSTPLLNPIFHNTESYKNHIFISTLIMITHGLFIYAQGFGKLARGIMKFHIDYKPEGAFEQLLEFIGFSFCNKPDYNLNSTLCEIIEYHNLTLEKDIIEISYLESIKELWNQDYPPGYFQGRPAAIGLVIFSLIWPHVKLILMHINLYKNNSQRVNYWLSIFGKWSLTDVLVMCLIISIFNIDIELSILEIWNALSSKFIELCEGICTSMAEPTFDCNSTCEYMDMLLNATVIPSNIPYSNIKITMEMNTLVGMYSFSIAVILSIFIDNFGLSSPSSPSKITKITKLLSLLMLFMLLMLFILQVPILQRHVIGSLPTALEIFGTEITLDKSYNLIDVATNLGNGNYGNTFIELVYLFFIIVAPLLYTIIVLNSERRHIIILALETFIAFELLILVVPMVSMTFGPMSALLLNSKTFPMCTIFDKLFPSKPSDYNTCMMINVSISDAYYLIIVICVLFLINKKIISN